MLNASVVDVGHEHVALEDPVELGRPGDEARRAFVDARARGQAAQRSSSCSASELPNISPIAMPIARITRAGTGRQPRRVRRRVRRGAEERGRVLGGVRGAVLDARGELVGRRAVRSR